MSAGKWEEPRVISRKNEGGEKFKATWGRESSLVLTFGPHFQGSLALREPLLLASFVGELERGIFNARARLLDRL
jgi:hypothetical protein